MEVETFFCRKCKTDKPLIERNKGTAITAKGISACNKCTTKISRDRRALLNAKENPQDYYRCGDCSSIFYYKYDKCNQCGSENFDDYLS